MRSAQSISSYLTTQLLAWRNPHGAEEHWVGPEPLPRVEVSCNYLGRVVTTELGLALLTLAALVETVLWTAETLIFLPALYFESGLFYFYATLLRSSSFTLLWNITNLFRNLFSANLLTREDFARYRFEAYNPLPSPLFFKMSNHLRVSDWCVEHLPPPEQRRENMGGPLLAPLLAVGIAGHPLVVQGGRFLIDDVLRGASEETLDRFNQIDPGLIPFVLTKALFIYAFGERRAEPIPDFFAKATRQIIQPLRLWRPPAGLAEALATPAQFEAFVAPREGDIGRVPYVALRDYAAYEMQGNRMLVRRCWPKAIDLIPQNPPEDI